MHEMKKFKFRVFYSYTFREIPMMGKAQEPYYSKLDILSI